ncbi:hypothetical protein DW042_19890 [Bacteroides xylanisolvens]|uniref:Glycosyltransferase family 52 n=1 Tax=Bacteroides xylanisolvens TaxID=371601 RepID=A0A415HFX6_9BACE|nr:hypothetical protein [Bacteroides xylanisolvens]RHK91522.1 hypothetical protein DW042_19890 [Bacteroides xylanisolvens]
MDRSLIIFFQAPADLPYVLKLYEENVGKRLIHIYVINVENNYKFITKLNLKVDSITFIPYLNYSVKRIFSCIKAFIQIRGIYKKYFLKIHNADIYFFSIITDWMTSFFVVNLTKDITNIVLYADHYDHIELRKKVKKLTFKQWVNSTLALFISTIPYDYHYEREENIYSFPYQLYNIKKTVAQSINNFGRYSFNIDCVMNGKYNILFLVNPWGYEGLQIADRECTEVMQLIKKLQSLGANIIIKGHPRMGLNQRVRDIADFVIPEYIPSQFINVNNINLVIGVETTGLFHYIDYSDIPVFSIVKLLNSVGHRHVNRIVTFLDTHTNGRMKYFESVDHLISFVKTNK